MSSFTRSSEPQPAGLTSGSAEWAADVADASPPVLDNPAWLLSPGVGLQAPGAPDTAAVHPGRVVSVPRFDAPAPVDWATRVQSWIAPGALLLAAVLLVAITWQVARRRRRRRRFRMRY